MQLTFDEETIIIKREDLKKVITDIIDEVRHEETDEVLNLNQAAELLGTDSRTIKRMLRDKVIPGIQYGQVYKFSKNALKGALKG
jgi:excisionase family DNA binding protein